MRKLIKQRLGSDQAASVSVETIIVIALAVFAGLALFSFILTPVQESADDLGTGISGWMKSVISSGGDANSVDGFGATP